MQFQCYLLLLNREVDTLLLSFRQAFLDVHHWVVTNRKIHQLLNWCITEWVNRFVKSYMAFFRLVVGLYDGAVVSTVNSQREGDGF